jgi:hypothetical protein
MVCSSYGGPDELRTAVDVVATLSVITKSESRSPQFCHDMSISLSACRLAPMPNRATRVPEGSPPPLPAGPHIAAVVAIADAFMIAMVSRPVTGSLRNTWVTPATFWLAVLTAGVSTVLVGLGALSFDGLARLAAVVIGALLLLGSASVFLVGGLQRRR